MFVPIALEQLRQRPVPQKRGVVDEQARIELNALICYSAHLAHRQGRP
jgi:hypothetical protein